MSLRKLSDQIIYKSLEHGSNYNSFPSALVNRRGEILVGFRQARDLRYLHGETHHCDPASRAVMVTSRDGGASFSLSLIHDDFLHGIQDPCLNLLRDGSIFATFFSWRCEPYREVPASDERHHLCYEDRYIARPAGLYTTLSPDGGVRWNAPLPVEPDPGGIRGTCVELDDGSILMPAYTGRDRRVFLRRTVDRGVSWQPHGELTHPLAVGETSLFRTASGDIVALMRSGHFVPDDPQSAPLITSISHDEGKTWSTPVTRPFHSPSPFHALQLRSGRVLISYGYRFAPYGIRAFLLDGKCEKWDGVQETILRDDGLDKDIGYTSAVQLANGEIWIFYYYYDSDGYRYIGATICREV